MKSAWPSLFLVPLLLGNAVHAETNVCSASYITDETRGEQTINQFGTNFQTINVFSFEFSADCRIVAKSPWVEQVSESLRNDPNRLILINIVNDIEPGPGACQSISPGQLIQNILSDPVKRADHIRQLVALSSLGQGIEIDYEHVLNQTTALYTQFMQELRAALPAGKRLAAVVQPKTQGGGEQGQTINWHAIEPYVDFIRVMAYYYSYNTSVPGPVISYEKLAQLGDYILHSPTQSIPANKARIMLSLYGWDWPVSPSGPGKLIRLEEAMAIAHANNITPQRDPTQDTLKFQYQDAAGTTHEVWVEDALGIQKRIQLLMNQDFPAIDLWHLNTGDNTFWSWFKPLVRSDCPSLAVPVLPAASAVLSSFITPTLPVGSAQTTISIAGSGFTPSDIILWAGDPYLPANVTNAQIQFTVPSSEFQKAGVTRVAITQGARLSNVLNFYVVGNPVLTAFEPSSAFVGLSAINLTVRGTGFEPQSQVKWNSQNIPTQFVNDRELHATVGPSLIAEPSTVRIGVINPTTDARISQNFFVLPSTAAPSPQAGINFFGVGPNPWKAGTHTGGIRFFGVSPEEVKIFTVSGRFVAHVSSSNGTGTWDLTNENGESVASGLYLYLATRADGGKERGTLAVIR